MFSPDKGLDVDSTNTLGLVTSKYSWAQLPLGLPRVAEPPLVGRAQASVMYTVCCVRLGVRVVVLSAAALSYSARERSG